MKTLKKKSCISVTKCPQWWGPGDPKEALWTSSITCELVRNADAGPTPQICLIRTCIFTSAPVTCLTCSSLKKLCHGTFLGPTCWAKLLQSCPTLCHSTDYSPPGSSVHGVLQARMLEWVAMPSSRASSRPRDQALIFYVSCTGRQVLYH